MPLLPFPLLLFFLIYIIFSFPKLPMSPCVQYVHNTCHLHNTYTNKNTWRIQIRLQLGTGSCQKGNENVQISDFNLGIKSNYAFIYKIDTSNKTLWYLQWLTGIYNGIGHMSSVMKVVLEALPIYIKLKHFTIQIFKHKCVFSLNSTILKCPNQKGSIFPCLLLFSLLTAHLSTRLPS